MEGGADPEVIREAFTVRLKEGALQEWVRRHEAIWPDLLEEQQRCGFVSMSVFAADPLLFVFSEVLFPDSWTRFIDTDVHKRWVEAMRDLSESARDDSTMDRGGLPEVLHLAFAPVTAGSDRPA